MRVFPSDSSLNALVRPIHTPPPSPLPLALSQTCGHEAPPHVGWGDSAQVASVTSCSQSRNRWFPFLVTSLRIRGQQVVTHYTNDTSSI